MKVKGIVSPETGMKDFIVTYNGQEHHCSRSGQKFTWNGHRGTLKALKGAIIQHHESEDPIAEKAAVDPSRGSTWDTDAAALLALMVKTETRDKISIYWIKDCLDKHGYLCEDGRIDTESAETAVNNIYKKEVRDE